MAQILFWDRGARIFGTRIKKFLASVEFSVERNLLAGEAN